MNSVSPKGNYLRPTKYEEMLNFMGVQRNTFKTTGRLFYTHSIDSTLKSLRIVSAGEAVDTQVFLCVAGRGSVTTVTLEKLTLFPDVEHMHITRSSSFTAYMPQRSPFLLTPEAMQRNTHGSTVDNNKHLETVYVSIQKRECIQ